MKPAPKPFSDSQIISIFYLFMEYLMQHCPADCPTLVLANLLFFNFAAALAYRGGRLRPGGHQHPGHRDRRAQRVDDNSITLDDLVTQLKALDPGRPVRIVAIGITSDADADSLNLDSVEVTGGIELHRRDPMDIRGIFTTEAAGSSAADPVMFLRWPEYRCGAFRRSWTRPWLP